MPSPGLCGRCGQPCPLGPAWWQPAGAALPSKTWPWPLSLPHHHWNSPSGLGTCAVFSPQKKDETLSGPLIPTAVSASLLSLPVELPERAPESAPRVLSPLSSHQSGSVQLTGGTSLSWSDGVPQAWMEVAAPPTAFPPQDWVLALPSDPPSDPHQAHTGCLDGQWGARRP